jgi:hypothetical protein
MTPDEFAEALRRLVSAAENEGLELPEMIAALEDQAEAMQLCVDE